jgi:hypothetical protein
MMAIFTLQAISLIARAYERSVLATGENATRDAVSHLMIKDRRGHRETSHITVAVHRK